MTRQELDALARELLPGSNPTWWGIEHACGGQERAYPTLHWVGEGPDDTTANRPRTHLVCDACGESLRFPRIIRRPADAEQPA